MTAALLAAAFVGQMYGGDFAFVRAQEEWIRDAGPRDASYTWYVPAAIDEQILEWSTPDPARQKAAVRALVAEGAAAAGPMVQASHARDQSVVHLSRIVIEAVRRCPDCRGTGTCPGFEDAGGGACKHCSHVAYGHDEPYGPRECEACLGRGFDASPPGR